jgi:frataxin-like iron-binding protein CyaY
VAYAFSALSQSQRLECEIKGATKPFTTQEELSVFFNERTQEEQHWLLASLQLLQDYALKREDWISQRSLASIIQQVKTELGNTDYSETYQVIMLDYENFVNRKRFTAPGSILLIATDFLLRVLFLIIGNSFSWDASNIIAANFYLSIPVLLIGHRISKRDKKFNETRIANMGFQEGYKLNYKFTTLQYTLIGILFATSVVITGLLQSDEPNLLLQLTVATSILLYYGYLLYYTPIGRFSDHALLAQLHTKEDQQMDSDTNDEAIVLLETELNSSTGRLEAYVLESTLFGALAFSGFLQIIATDLISFADLEKFSSTVFHAGHGFVTANWQEYEKYSLLLNTKVNLFCLVSIETLLCSVLFLAVIASRLRFSDVSDKVRAALNLAKAYNEKEEGILEREIIDPVHKARLERFNNTIAQNMAQARKFMYEFTPIVAYMVYFRNAGLLVFLTVLFTSSLFIGGGLGLLFVAIGAATLVYFNFRWLLTIFTSLRLTAGIYFARHSWLVLAIILGFSFMGFVARVWFNFEDTGFLFAVTFFSLGLYTFIWFTVVPHPDQNFDERLEKQGEEKTRRWRLINSFYGVGASLIFIGIATKILGWNDANKLVYIGFLGVSFLNYLMFPYLSNPKWLGYILATVISCSLIGIFFRTMNFPGATEMNMIGTLSLPYFILVFILKRKTLHQMLVRMFLVFSIPTILFAEMFFAWVIIHPSLWTKSQMIYEHKTFKIDSIIDTYDKVRMMRGIEDHKKTKVFDEGIESLDRYVKTYGKTLGRTQVYDASLAALDEFIGMRVLNDAARERIYSGKWKVDPALTKMLFTAAEKMIKIDSLVGRYGFTTIKTQADLYHIFHQPEKEKAFLEKMLRLEKDEIVQREVKRSLEEFNTKEIR